MSESTVPEPSATPVSETDRLEATAESISDDLSGSGDTPVVDLDQADPPSPEENLEEDVDEDVANAGRD